jgi:hypothetical protein
MQRVGLATGAVQRHHSLRDVPAEWMLAHERQLTSKLWPMR